MSRRRKAITRKGFPDPNSSDFVVVKFTNSIMSHGRKSTAERIMRNAFHVIQEKGNRDPLELFEQALSNVSPRVEVRTRRVGGTSYSVPGEVGTKRSQALAIRWIISAARKRNEGTMEQRLGGELLDAANNRGIAVKRREDTHKVANANLAFSHYRW
ncbi:30S ribosomal protein S7 [Candidatus Liberibacter sp.]|uniref:30S ribosomal protein S7 n=1 Tax=Candidatus Liberibacter sp. TaxID=34022 RepID=UPI0015F771B5|nr:30S ribosomal protein S7 [Candidatus Liberibacter sp.]MBA5724247.1 30S ribosomal protein S7 [Candidatus Liberibacter sp.]